MNYAAGMALLGIESIRDRLLKRLEPVVNLHWAAYCGADAQLRASHDREETAKNNYSTMAKDWQAENNARRAFEKQNGELREIAKGLRIKLDLLIQHSNKSCLETWRAACREQGIALGRDDD